MFFASVIYKFCLNLFHFLFSPSSNAGASAASVQQSSTDATYWAKGTGFGTGSIVSNWDIEKAMKQKKKEEEDMVIIFQVSYRLLF